MVDPIQQLKKEEVFLGERKAQENVQINARLDAEKIKHLFIHFKSSLLRSIACVKMKLVIISCYYKYISISLFSYISSTEK